MQTGTEMPFATIESALEFLDLLGRAISDTVTDVDQDLADAQMKPDARRAQALQLVQYKLSLLSMHVHKSEKLLIDLGRLRRAMQGTGKVSSHVACAVAS
jgi:hypothetical protein